MLRSHAASDRDELFEVLDEAAAEALEGDRCAVFVPAPDGWTLWPAHQRRLRARYGAVPYARTLLEAVRVRQTPLLCTREGDLNPSASMVQAGVRSAMAAPLRIGQETHALLYVDRVAGMVPFTRTDLEFLAAVANQLAVQLHNREHVATLEAEVERLQARPAPERASLVWKDPLMQEVDAFVVRAATVQSPILVRGEYGSGKELVARVVHQGSSRGERPLTVCACAGLETPEAALFGRLMPGGEPRPGLLELADQGTVYLDEVDALPAPAQAALIGIIDRGTFTRPGDGALRRVDARIIAATSRDLDEEVHRCFCASCCTLSMCCRKGAAAAQPSRRHRRPRRALPPGRGAQARPPGPAPCPRGPEPAPALRLAWQRAPAAHVIERGRMCSRAERSSRPRICRRRCAPPRRRPPEPARQKLLAEIERAHIQRVLEHLRGQQEGGSGDPRHRPLDALRQAAPVRPDLSRAAYTAWLPACAAPRRHGRGARSLISGRERP